ncbi:MAG: TetR/AcrR family transcriptional regulator [Rhodobacteraceae bacterium]|nr:TetR/AcrR family transcriptional regulator [Paracoccaceae bacterium]
MPYTPEHRARTRRQIIDSARKLFNVHGFDGASIDQIMANAGFSRGGFYHHFKNKEDVFAEAVSSLLQKTTSEKPADDQLEGPALIKAVMEGYLSEQHSQNVEDQCPMIAVPSDVARAGPGVQRSYKMVFDAMLELFEQNLAPAGPDTRRQALTLCILSIGGMVLARSLGDAELSAELRAAARAAPQDLGIEF